MWSDDYFKTLVWNVGFVLNNELIVQFWVHSDRTRSYVRAKTTFFCCILTFDIFVFIPHLCFKYTKVSITWLRQGFHWGKHWGLPGEYSGGMWVQCPRPCSVKIAQPSSLWSGCRITSAIIIKRLHVSWENAICVLTSAGQNQMSWGGKKTL